MPRPSELGQLHGSRSRTVSITTRLLIRPRSPTPMATVLTCNTTTLWREDSYPGPAARRQSQGAIQTFAYDACRASAASNYHQHRSYPKRFFIGPNYVQSFATVNTSNDRSLAIRIVDGLGRVIGCRRNHPGSSGGYKGQLTVTIRWASDKTIESHRDQRELDSRR